MALEITVLGIRELPTEVTGKVQVRFWIDEENLLIVETNEKEVANVSSWNEVLQISYSGQTLHVQLRSEDKTIGSTTVHISSLNPDSKDQEKWFAFGDLSTAINLKIILKASTSEMKKQKRQSADAPAKSKSSSKDIVMTKKKAGGGLSVPGLDEKKIGGSTTERINRSQSGALKLGSDKKKSIKLKDDLVLPLVKERTFPEAPVIEVPKIEPSNISEEIWSKERRCLMMLLEARVILREMIEINMDNFIPLEVPPEPKGSLMAVELKRLLGLNPDDEDENRDLSAEIAELRRRLVIQVRDNQTKEKDLGTLEKKITLLIMNRSSIAELDRNAKKKAKRVDNVSLDNENVVLNDQIRMALYSNLFYLLQTQPKYLARLSQVVPQKKMDGFIETIILTLFGDAFSPREEFLMLTLFKLAIHQEIQRLTQIKDLTQVDSVVPKMIIAYTKRKQGKEYLQKVLTGPVTAVMDGKFENETDMENALNSFLEAIFNSLASLPYGFRLILQQMKEFMSVKFTQITDEEVGQIFGFYYYFKFLNPSIIDPSATGILQQDQVNLAAIANLSKLTKILKALFELRTLPKGTDEAKFNGWIKQKMNDVTEFFERLIDIKPPEDELQVDRYTELYSKQQPMIIVRLKEIADMHDLIKEFIDEVVGDDKDHDEPLRTIIRELGDVPKISESSTTDTQLVLKNRFGNRLEQELNDHAELFDHTKELIIKVFRVSPIDQAGTIFLPDILKFAAEYAKENENPKLENNAREALENVLKLEKVGFISPDDNYDQFLKSVAAEISNRALRREQQEKEIVKLRTALRELEGHYKFVTDRINDMDRYLESCREQLAAKIKNKKKKPGKFTYKQLVKEGVIADSDVPDTSKAKMVFFITMPELGKFNIEAKIGGIPVPTVMKLNLEDLLAKKDVGETKLELDMGVVLNVTPTVILMNKHFLR